ncbi:MAG: hypothetical protein ACJAQT_001410 [Akkermansiaceae bacterium]
MSKSFQLVGGLGLLLFAALLMGLPASDSGDGLFSLGGKRESVSLSHADLKKSHAVVRSDQVREISERKRRPLSIRVMTKFVEINQEPPEKLGFEWIETPFEQ